MSKLFNEASLVMIPSAYKDGKLYSIRPTDGDGDFTFSRGSNLAATRVDVNGLIEKGRENHILQSNSFSTASWAKTDSTPTSGQAGYDGTNNAWLLTADTPSPFSSRIEQSINLTGLQTYSIYAKAGLSDFVILEATGTNGYYAWFNLSTGAVGTKVGDISTDITSVGNGWYRCSITGNPSATSKARIFIADNDGTTAVVDGNYIYIQDAQLEAGLVATDYIETGASTAQAGILEDMPRLDYSGSCPALLLEPQRSNLSIQSEYITLVNNGTIDYNDTTSPEGLQNAVLFTSNNSAASYCRSNHFAATDPTNVSVFLKYTNNQYIQLLMSGDVGHYANFDIQNGSIGTSGAKTSNETIEDYGNGWYRISATFTGYTGNPTARVYLSDNLSAGYATAPSAIGQSVYVYGLQVESGIYPTSYIPTYGSSVTRGQDYTNDLNTTSFLSGNSYTILVDADLNDDTNNVVIMNFKTSTGTQSFTPRIFSNGSLRVYNQIDLIYPTSSIGSGSNKWVIRVDKSSFDIFSYNNGSAIKTSGTDLATPRNLGRIQLTGTSKYDVNQFVVFNTALTDAECKSLVE